MSWLDASDALLLARLQFAFTVSFHIIFPAFTIGLASYLAVLEALWLKTGRAAYLAAFNYWKKIFAITFGMGVVSGIVMSYQFGTNWSVFSDKAGPVLGPLLGYEVLTGLLPRGRLPRRHAFRHEPRRAAACISSPRSWSRSARCSRPSGSSPPTAGCRRRPAMPSTRPASSCRSTGGPSSSIRRFPTASCTWCWRPI